MPKKVTPEQRDEILRMLAQGHDRDTISVAVGVTPGQVSAISAHVRMGTYALPDLEEQPEVVASVALDRTSNLLGMLQNLEGLPGRETRLSPIYLGSDAEIGEEVSWNPAPASGSANPHVLILGESGFGKTYTIASLSAELAQENVVSVVFDYGQGFSPATRPGECRAAGGGHIRPRLQTNRCATACGCPPGCAGRDGRRRHHEGCPRLLGDRPSRLRKRAGEASGLRQQSP